MSDWKAVLQKLVQFRDRLPEELRDGFHAAPPAQGPWPIGLPPSAALREFYSLCDGGSIGAFTISGRGELEDLSEWSGDEKYDAGQYWIIGDTQFGLPLVWDSREDRIGYHDHDGADGLVMSDETGAEMMGLSLDAFLAHLFSRPVNPRDDVLKLWAEALNTLDRFA